MKTGKRLFNKPNLRKTEKKNSIKPVFDENRKKDYSINPILEKTERKKIQ